MHKAQRLVQLIMLVNERRTFTVQELADECGVSRRTMIRDLAELSELGILFIPRLALMEGIAFYERKCCRRSVLPSMRLWHYFLPANHCRTINLCPLTMKCKVRCASFSIIYPVILNVKSNTCSKD